MLLTMKPSAANLQGSKAVSFRFLRQRGRAILRSGLFPGMVALALLGSSAPAMSAPPSVGPAAAAVSKQSCHQSRWLAKYACVKPVISKVPYAVLRQRLVDYIEEQKAKGVLKDAGLYFRDLEDGPHFGVNEYTNFAAASLLKLPIVIQYLSLAEQDPELLRLPLVVPSDMEELYSANYQPPEKLVAGESHTVEDVLYRTMAYSDNLAFFMLRQHLVDKYGSETSIWESYRQLGLVPDIADRNFVITVSRYASMFKPIYNASYLGSAMSEKLIDLMRASVFKVGLVQGVPAGVPVAHKFGEMGRDGVIQLHDCGIVYYPGNPYVLCVMTRGNSYPALETVLQDVSRMVYAEVDSRRVGPR